MRVFVDEFSNYTESAIVSKEELIITGDFNIHVGASRDPDAMNFLELLDSFGLQ